jgi:hypothetical protein|nr:MAG TPA: hypothetical protein [Caudoviricetes sp.]
MNIAAGQCVKFHNEPCLVLEHRQNGTLLMTCNQIEAKFGGSNNYAKSALAKHLNSTFLEALTENHVDEVLLRKVDLTAVNGSTEYGSVVCRVAPLTLDEYRRSRDIIPLPESWEWFATPWSTPAVNEDDTWVAGLDTSGLVDYNNYYNSRGSRPAFLIPSDYAVEVDEENPLEQFSLNDLLAEINRRVTSEE